LRITSKLPRAVARSRIMPGSEAGTFWNAGGDPINTSRAYAAVYDRCRFRLIERVGIRILFAVLHPGTKVGRYEIRSQLGAGGMGEVYLALDTRLDRKVAVKILPEEVAADPDRMKRFVQEAKAASGLNHPNIITIYEIDQTGSTPFIAAEYIDGRTLRERTRTPLSLGEALNVAVQIASALAAAHTSGIVHRDIKPENVIVRSDGIAKVLDFGLAKLSGQEPAEWVDSE